VLLRHFNTLLGYSNSEKCFTIPPARLRRAAVCNAFLHGLPGVLDSNLLIGNQVREIFYPENSGKLNFFSYSPLFFNFSFTYLRLKNLLAMPLQPIILFGCFLHNKGIIGCIQLSLYFTK